MYGNHLTHAVCAGRRGVGGWPDVGGLRLTHSGSLIHFEHTWTEDPNYTLDLYPSVITFNIMQEKVGHTESTRLPVKSGGRLGVQVGHGGSENQGRIKGGGILGVRYPPPPLLGDPKLHKEGTIRCAHACENAAFWNLKVTLTPSPLSEILYTSLEKISNNAKYL